MISKKILLILIIILCCMSVLPQIVTAHVLISDDTQSVGAVLHIVPDDDPIAGELTNLLFDIQAQKIDKNNPELTITNTATRAADDVPIKVDGSSVTADYTFLTQGVYKISLVVSSDNTYTFSYTQRVSRGLTGSALDKPTYPLANLALVFCSTLFLFLLIIMLNRRKEIKSNSTF